MVRPLLRLGALVLALASVVASATVVAWETLDDMARRVPLIVRGRVLRSVSGWDDSHRRIWTWTELAVTDSIKGTNAGLVLVKQPGGEVEGIGQAVAGAARFQEGEDCVLLLEPAPDEKGAFRPSGLSAGKISIVTTYGKTVAMRATEGISFAPPTGKKVERVQSPELLGSPESFVQHLRALVEVKR